MRAVGLALGVVVGLSFARAGMVLWNRFTLPQTRMRFLEYEREWRTKASIASTKEVLAVSAGTAKTYSERVRKIDAWLQKDFLQQWLQMDPIYHEGGVASWLMLR